MVIAIVGADYFPATVKGLLLLWKNLAANTPSALLLTSRIQRHNNGEKERGALREDPEHGDTPALAGVSAEYVL